MNLQEQIKSYTLPEPNYAFESTISYSQYSIWSKCNHQWYLAYGKNLKPDGPNIYTCFGTSIHETLQNYLEVLYNKSSIEADDLDIVEYFNERLRENYKLEYEKTQVHFSSAVEMREFFDDGCAILQFFKDNRRQYFGTKQKLLGIELPILHKLNNSLYFKGYIDFVLYDEEEDIITIYDIKTSTRGWSDKDKKDEIKISQVLLYKEFFAKQYRVEVDKVDVKYFIVKRKIYESSQYNLPRIQTFSPSNGKLKRKKTMDGLGKFVEDCFGGSHKAIEKEYTKNPGYSCKYCPFNDKPELCDKKQ